MLGFFSRFGRMQCRGWGMSDPRDDSPEAQVVRIIEGDTLDTSRDPVWVDRPGVWLAVRHRSHGAAAGTCW